MDPKKPRAAPRRRGFFAIDISAKSKIAARATTRARTVSLVRDLPRPRPAGALFYDRESKIARRSAPGCFAKTRLALRAQR